MADLRLYVNVHHVAFDGGSLRYFQRDLWAFYEVRSCGAAAGFARKRDVPQSLNAN